MLLSILGTPSAFTAWGGLLIRTLIEESRGGFQYIAVVTFDDLQTAFKARTKDQVIIYSDSPDAMMTDLLLRVKIPVVIFVEERADVVGYVMKSRGMDVRNAIRFTCQSYTCLSEFYRAAGAKVFYRRDNASAAQVLNEMAAHFGIALSGPESARILSKMGASSGPASNVGSQILVHVPDARKTGAWSPELGPEGLRLVETVLQTYSELGPARHLTHTRWPKELFYDGNRVGEHVSGPIDLTGRARFLAWAPYLHLPRGDWAATIHLRVGDSFSINTILVDVKAGDVLSSGRIELPPEGDFIFSLPFEIADPRVPVEIRFALEKGAIEGWIDIVDVAIEADDRAAREQAAARHHG